MIFTGRISLGGSEVFSKTNKREEGGVNKRGIENSFCNIDKKDSFLRYSNKSTLYVCNI